MTDDCYEHPALTALIAKRAARPPRSADDTVKAPKPVVTPQQQERDARAVAKLVINSHMGYLRQELKVKGFMIVPVDPSDTMIAASMATATRYVGHMPKREKHRLRLQAALTAEALKAGVVE